MGTTLKSRGAPGGAVCAADDTTASAAFSSQEITCFRCGVIAPHRQEDGQWGPHRRRLVCQDCGGFVKWMPVCTAEEREVKRQEGIRRWQSTQPPTEAQLRYLAHLGHTGETPLSRLEASEAINAFLRQRSARL